MEDFALALIASHPYSFELLKAAGPPLVALVVAFIASLIQYNQWRTARDTVRLNLFEQRIHVYDQIFIFFNEKITQSKISQDEFRTLEKAMNAAQFLFPADVFRYLVALKGLLEAYRDAFIRWKVDEDKKSGITDEQRENADRMRAILETFNIEWSRSSVVFAPYLSFGHIRR